MATRSSQTRRARVLKSQIYEKGSFIHIVILHGCADIRMLGFEIGGRHRRFFGVSGDQFRASGFDSFRVGHSLGVFHVMGDAGRGRVLFNPGVGRFYRGDRFRLQIAPSRGDNAGFSHHRKNIGFIIEVFVCLGFVRFNLHQIFADIEIGII